MPVCTRRSVARPLVIMCASACLRVLDPCAGEDDGYLMVYVTKSDGTSYMHVYDAATMDATPVAEVRRAATVNG